MRSRGIGGGLVLITLLLPGAGVFARANNPPLTEQQKIAIIQDLITDVGIARHPFPANKKGMELSTDGKLLDPGDPSAGIAAKTGDRVAVTAINFKDDRIVFLINGGPNKTHWYQHVQIGLGGMGPSSATTGQNLIRGAEITLRFPSKIPPLTPANVRQYLGSLIDWDPPSKAQVMVQALPPPVKSAIDDHRVLVGMNADMVIAARGRTENKSRETDDATGIEYEDWVYGAPPGDTTFVRMADNRVVRVTTYQADGKTVVDSRPEPALVALQQRQDNARAEAAAASAANPSAAAPGASQGPPTLRRPGDAPLPNGVGGQPSMMPPAGGPPQQGPPGQTQSGCCELRDF